jgi:hypothetical protein
VKQELVGIFGPHHKGILSLVARLPRSHQSTINTCSLRMEALPWPLLTISPSEPWARHIQNGDHDLPISILRFPSIEKETTLFD